MISPRTPVFVQRRTYRRRRTADGARMLPLLGAVLFAIPLAWPRGDATGTSDVMIYVFATWVLLVLVSGILSRFLISEAEQANDDADGPASQLASGPASGPEADPLPEDGAGEAP